MKTISLIFIILLITGCSLNKIFLHPYPLTTDRTFEAYDTDKEDTLRLAFDANENPIFSYDNDSLEYYDIEKHTVFFAEDSIDAWYFRSNNPNGKTIYYLHGNAGNMVYQYQLMTPFVDKGYNVFMIDYSGFGFSSGKATRKNVLKSAEAGFDYLKSYERLKNNEIIIYGQSLGGHLSAVIANEYQDDIGLLVVEGAFSSHKDIANDNVKVLGRIFTKEIYSAEKNIYQIKKPILIIHSNEDSTINISHGERLYDLANQPKMFYEVDKPHVLAPLYYADSIDLKMNLLLNRK